MPGRGGVSVPEKRGGVSVPARRDGVLIAAMRDGVSVPENRESGLGSSGVENVLSRPDI